MPNLGAVVLMSATFRDATGALIAATTPILTVTLPDQTTVTPTLTNPSTGLYQYSYKSTKYGFHSWEIAAAEGNVGDSFNINVSTNKTLVSLADFKRHLNITTTTDDNEMRDMLQSTTTWVNSACGYSIPTVINETISVPLGGASALVLNQYPVISVQTITPLVTTIGVLTPNIAKIVVDSNSAVIFLSTGLSFYGSYDISYTVGRQDASGNTVVPDDLQELTLLLGKWMWETQRGAGSAGGIAGFSDDDDPAQGRYGSPLPPRAMYLLTQYERPNV